MARTNKMGILKKKQQQAKQKGLTGEKVRASDGMKRSYTNPKGHEYEWFLRSGKRICDSTSAREDPDGFRLRRHANGGEADFVHIGTASRSFRRRLRKGRQMNTKK